MKRFGLIGAAVIVVLVLGVAAWQRSGVGWEDVVPGRDVPVKNRPSFSQDVLPIFQEFCVLCHSAEDAHNGLRLDSYEGVMRGTDFGPVVKAGDPDLSNLVILIKHESDPEIFMPFHKEKLSPNRIKIIENWIKIGAPNN